jgi:phenylacetic acid degradation protein
MQVYSIDGITPVVDPSAYVHPTAVLIGDVIVGPNCYVGPNAALRGDFGRLILKAGANLQDTCVMHGFPGTDTVVEEYGHIGHGAVLHGCHIGRNSLVGMNAVVMDGAEIGPECIVAACAFVKAKFECPERSMVVGSPAKVIRQVSDQEIGWKTKGTEEYQELARRSLATMTRGEPLTEVEPDRARIEIDSVKPKYQTKND